MKNNPNNPKKSNKELTGFTLWLVCNLWQREMRRALLPFDLTHAQFILLKAAHDLSQQTEQDISQMKLANVTGTDKMMVSKILRTLEAKKLLKRAGMKTDSRAKKVTITPKGIELFSESQLVVEDFERDFFLPAIKNEKGLTKALSKILKNYDNGRPMVDDDL